MATSAQKIPRLAPAMAAIATLPRALARRHARMLSLKDHARTLSLKDTSRFAPDNDGQYWPKTNSPEWLALQKRPSSGGPIGPRAPHDGGPIGPRAPRDGGPIGPRAPRDGGSRSFFGIPADDAPPVRSPVEEGWLEQRRKARIEEQAREMTAVELLLDVLRMAQTPEDALRKAERASLEEAVKEFQDGLKGAAADDDAPAAKATAAKAADDGDARVMLGGRPTAVGKFGDVTVSGLLRHGGDGSRRRGGDGGRAAGGSHDIAPSALT